MNKKVINITIGPDVSSSGGISTVLNVMRDSGFFEKWQVVLLRTKPTNENKKAFFGLFRYFVFAKALVMLVYYHLFYKVNLVHIHTSSRWSFFRKSCVVRLTKLCGGHVVLHLHGSEFREFYEDECSEKKKQEVRKIFNLADTVVVLSTQWLDWVERILECPERAVVVYNSVPEVPPSKSERDPNLILFLGRIGPRKGAEDLINAFARISKDFPEARLALGGDGDIEAFKRLVSTLGLDDRIDFLGWVSGDEKSRWLRQAGIYALPSYNEGFPMGVLEAMSAGATVLASRAGGIPDAITHKKEGLLVEAGDVDGIAECLRMLLSDEDLRSMYAAQAKNKFLNNFSPDVIFPQLDSIYAQFSDSK